jgi:hypothetical protein
MELAHLDLDSPQFVEETHRFVCERYPMSEQDMIDYHTGYVAFCESVKRARVLLVAHTLVPAMFGLPQRHKSSVSLEFTPGYKQQ